jgi:hypothetical protein
LSDIRDVLTDDIRAVACELLHQRHVTFKLGGCVWGVRILVSRRANLLVSQEHFLLQPSA